MVTVERSELFVLPAGIVLFRYVYRKSVPKIQTDIRTYRRTDNQTDRQVQNISLLIKGITSSGLCLSKQTQSRATDELLDYSELSEHNIAAEKAMDL